MTESTTYTVSTGDAVEQWYDAEGNLEYQTCIRCGEKHRASLYPRKDFAPPVAA